MGLSESLPEVYPDYPLFTRLCQALQRDSPPSDADSLQDVRRNLALHPVWKKLDSITNRWLAHTLARSMERYTDCAASDPLDTLLQWLEQRVPDRVLTLLAQLPQQPPMQWDSAHIKHMGQDQFALYVQFQWDTVQGSIRFMF
jgi:hypothetical protein